MSEAVIIDGSMGEGGGQILRSALTLALVSGRGFVIENIRAGRNKPGLMRQHLTSVHAAAQIGGARVQGDEIGSRRLEFEPGPIRAGEYHFSIGTAGSCTLVLQTILPALLATAGHDGPTAGPSKVTLEGGTHNPFAPPFDFLERSFLPQLAKLRGQTHITLERPGFYPAGGGRFAVAIESDPPGERTPFALLERGALVRRQARVILANLPRNIAERERDTLRKKLNWPEDDPTDRANATIRMEDRSDATGPGNLVLVELEYENVCEVFVSFGQQGKSAEQVAREVARDVRRYLVGSAPVGEYLADQLLLPLALFGGGRFRTQRLSRHATTNIQVIQQFLMVPITTERMVDDSWLVTVGGTRRP